MTVYVVDIEPVESRYTAQWKEHLPQQLRRNVDCDVVVISGGDTPQATTPGAFLNFGGTNVYKSKQLEQIGELFCKGQIKNGDYFLYTDAWNPTVLQLRYMAELLGVSIRIGGLWHAGSYDPHDFLGRLIGNTPWVRHSEKAMFYAYDQNFFATQFHIDIFLRNLLGIHGVNDRDGAELINSGKIVRTGWPMEYLANSLDQYRGMEKEDLILFPHRLAPEKQVDIFRDLKEQLPQYEFVVCQDQELTKNEYHNLLGRAKVVFSANLQETLGISWYEGALVGTIPLVPDRLSYSEMANSPFKYPSKWTKDVQTYQNYKSCLVSVLIDMVKNYSQFLPALHQQTSNLTNNFFSGEQLYKAIAQQ